MADFDYDLIDDLEVTYTDVELYDIPNYHTSIKLNGTSLIMYVKYNARNKTRSISIQTLDGFTLLPFTFVKFNRRCELNRIAEFEGLSYYVTLRPNNIGKEIRDDYDYLNWSNDFTLCFVGFDYSFVERMDLNLRVYLTGN